MLQSNWCLFFLLKFTGSGYFSFVPEAVICRIVESYSLCCAFAIYTYQYLSEVPGFFVLQADMYRPVPLLSLTLTCLRLRNPSSVLHSTAAAAARHIIDSPRFVAKPHPNSISDTNCKYKVPITTDSQILTYHRKPTSMETRKLLIQMSGAPGSGKSTLANLLAQHRSISAVVINHDLIKSFFLDSGITFQKSAELTYNLQWVLVGDLLKQGRNVIVDSICNYQETLDQGTALARQHGYDYAYVECAMSTSDIGLLEQRLRARVGLRSQRNSVEAEPKDVDGANSSHDDAFARYKRWIETPARPASDSIITVDSTCSPADCLSSALKQLGLPAEALPSSTSIESSCAGPP